LILLVVSACRVTAVPGDALPRLHRVGLLSSRSPQPWYGALEDGLRDLGYVSGSTVAIEYRYAEGDSDRLPSLVSELVDLRVEAIVAADTASLDAARSAEAAIPVIMALGGDPVASGVVTSMARPGGNVTGLSSVEPSVAGKRLDLLKAAIPSLARAGVLRNPDNPARAAEWADLVQAADAAGIKLVDLSFREPDDIDRSFERAAALAVDAVIVVGEPMISVERDRIARLASGYALPLMYERGELLQSGGLIAYGVPLSAVYRRSATYVDRILKGASPAELPIEIPVSYELAINLRTAGDLGLSLSPALLMQVDRFLQ
jgi:putative ABC transport system substrate-binding protein